MCCRTHTCRWSGWREQEWRTATQKAEDQEVLFPLSSVRYAGCTAGESTGSRRVRLSEERHVAALCSPLTCSPQSSHIPVCPPTPPRAPCLHIRFFSWFQFQLLRVVKSDVLPLSDMSCKSTPIESHHFVTVCPVNRKVFVWTSVLWLCSWEPPLAFLMPFSHRPKICSHLWLYRYEYERMVVCLSVSCDRLVICLDCTHRDRVLKKVEEWLL